MSGQVAALLLSGLYLLSLGACARRSVAAGGPLAARDAAARAVGVQAAADAAPAAASLLAPEPSGQDPALADLWADDLQLRAATYVNPAVVRLDLERQGRRWRAKWKAMGAGGSELQEGLDGNNSPRCEVAAYRLSLLLAGAAGEPLVPPVVVRALHRDVPCDRSCRGIPKLIGADTPATFPAINDHLVLGAMTLWIEGARPPQRLHGELWSPSRFAAQRGYRRSISDLFLFLYVIAHGDANYGPNFLLRTADQGRVYSIDNGRAFDGVPYYVGEGEPDWQPLAELSASTLIAPSFAAASVRALAQFTEPRLQQELALVAAVELKSGRSVRDLRGEKALAAIGGEPLEGRPGLVQRSRQTYTYQVDGGTFVLLGIGRRGIAQTAARAQQAAAYLRRPGAMLFGD